MKLYAAFFYILATFIFMACKNDTHSHRQPTDGTTQVRLVDESQNQSSREEWFELMHTADRLTDWRAIEYQTQMQRHHNQSFKDNSANQFANDRIQAEWHERGSNNQSGNVRITAYDARADEIFAIGDGGSLFKGNRDGSNWTVVNQQLRFNRNMLQVIPLEQGRRLIAAIGRIPHYSDDEGNTWNPASGIAYSSNGGRLHSTLLSENQGHIYVLSKKYGNDRFTLYRSVDTGITYQQVIRISTNHPDRASMMQPAGHAQILISDYGSSSTSVDIYAVSDDTTFYARKIQQGVSSGGNVEVANLTGAVYDDVLHLYRYKKQFDYKVEMSLDTGKTWIEQGVLPKRPWGVGIYAIPSAPNTLVMGEVECYRSIDDGATWVLRNHWYEYYGNVETKLHADIMHFREYKTAQREPFLLISNHGGISISYNNAILNTNIGLAGLNVSQYYDVVSPSEFPGIIYAGSQDQGFQRSVEFNNSTQVMDCDQVISGDYGHLTLSGEEQHLWMVYPGGWITVYTEPIVGYLTADWQLPNNTSVWIPPLHEVYREGQRYGNSAVLLGGGYTDTMSQGSYLLELTYDKNNANIQVSAGAFNFNQHSSGGSISAIEISDVNPQQWYVVTTNGVFFYSEDAGMSWHKSETGLVSGNYLYGQGICASHLNDSVVYVGGSGYSSHAAWLSTDAGRTFTGISNGLPSTLIYDLALSSTEEYLFAATEAGPYVYVVAEDSWYDLNDDANPTTTYWSVQYIPMDGASDLVRYGTYGRGTWDFVIEEIVLSTSTVVKEHVPMQVFPNPASQVVSIQSEVLRTGVSDLRLYSLSGQLVHQTSVSAQIGSTDLRVDHLRPGTYILVCINEKGDKSIEKLIVSR